MTNDPLKLARKILDNKPGTTLSGQEIMDLAQAYISLHAKLERYEKALKECLNAMSIAYEDTADLYYDNVYQDISAALEGKDND